MANVLNISDAASLGMHTTAYMALDPQTPQKVPVVAEMLDVSEAHLSKVMQRLHHAGLVDSIRGPKGGYKLAVDPEKTALLEIYEAIEGPIPETHCLLGRPVCSGEECILGGMVKRVNREVRAYLAETRLSNLAGVYRKRGTKKEAVK